MQDILRQPETIEDLGIPPSIVTDMMLRMLFTEGDVSLRRFADVMRISATLIDTLLLRMQQEHIIEVSKAGNIGRGSYIYWLTEGGVGRSRGALERTKYSGAVPVPIEG